MTGGIIQQSDEFREFFTGLSKTRENYEGILILLLESLNRLEPISASIYEEQGEGESESVHVTDYYSLFGRILDDAMNLLYYGPFFRDEKEKIGFKQISDYLQQSKEENGECKHEFWPQLKAKLGGSKEIRGLIRKLQTVYFTKRNPSAHTSLPTAIEKFSENDFNNLKSFLHKMEIAIDELVEEGI